MAATSASAASASQIRRTCNELDHITVSLLVGESAGCDNASSRADQAMCRLSTPPVCTAGVLSHQSKSWSPGAHLKTDDEGNRGQATGDASIVPLSPVPCYLGRQEQRRSTRLSSLGRSIGLGKSSTASRGAG